MVEVVVVVLLWWGLLLIYRRTRLADLPAGEGSLGSV